jgi:hypothetical protein
MSLQKSAGAVTSALLVSAMFTAPAAAQAPVFSGPVAYTNITNSLFFATQKVGQDYYLEDFERGVITAPGLSVSDPSAVILAPGATTDSVDIDDALLDGLGSGGRSLANTTIGTLNLQFNAGTLGGFPTKVGLVWTDGSQNSSVTLTVIGGNGNVGFQTFTNLGDADSNGGTGEDRFIGIEFAEGIAQIQVAGSGATVEIDHVQYTAPVAGERYIRDRMDGDVKSDLVWHDPANGNVDVWLMNGLSRAGGLATQTASATWVAQGIGDLDDDGDADVIWRDSVTNLFHVWIMNGQTVQESAQMIGPASLASTWVCIGVGDTNADRKADIIFRNTSTNALSIWYMKRQDPHVGRHRDRREPGDDELLRPEFRRRRGLQRRWPLRPPVAQRRQQQGRRLADQRPYRLHGGGRRQFERRRHAVDPGRGR